MLPFYKTHNFKKQKKYPNRNDPLLVGITPCLRTMTREIKLTK